jgi:sugar phosphate isomerase/epimerase
VAKSKTTEIHSFNNHLSIMPANRRQFMQQLGASAAGLGLATRLPTDLWAETSASKDQAYLKELKQRTDDLGMRNVLIMVDNEGALGGPDTAKRRQAVENHYKWVDAAKFLGYHSIRVNLEGKGTPEEIAKACVDGYGQLVESVSMT